MQGDKFENDSNSTKERKLHVCSFVMNAELHHFDTCNLMVLLFLNERYIIRSLVRSFSLLARLVSRSYRVTHLKV